MNPIRKTEISTSLLQAIFTNVNACELLDSHFEILVSSGMQNGDNKKAIDCSTDSQKNIDLIEIAIQSCSSVWSNIRENDFS